MEIQLKKIIKFLTPDMILDIYRNLIIKIMANKAKKYHRDAFLYKKESGNVIIVFIVYQPQSWNSLKSVYEAAAEHPNVVPYVIVIDGETRLGDNNPLTALKYFKSVCSNVIDCTGDNGMLDLNKLKPDFVFRQTTYDNSYPKEYGLAEMSKFTKTCYIPYNYNFSPLKHLEIEYGMNALINLYAVFSESESNADYCRRQAERLNLDLHVFNMGFPRFDLLARNSVDAAGKSSVFTWIPRWSLDGENNDSSSFFKYNEKLIEYFRLHKDLKLIIRPHPLMFDNFIKLGVMTNEEVKKYKNNIERESNMFLDDNIDYLETFFDTDVLIADMSSINYEFYLMGKPMIYCGNPLEYNAETRNMMECSYIVSNWRELKDAIEQLSDGIDPTFDKRKNDIKNIFSNMPSDIGKRIVDKCVSIIR